MAKIWIPKEDYVDDAPTTELESPVNINHDSCKAGRDYKQRLYIWRKADGSVSSYCHHCGGSGYIKSGSTRNLYKLRKGSGVLRSMSTTASPEAKLPFDYTQDLTKWSIPAKAWVFAGGLSALDIKRHKLGYSASLDRVVLPVYERISPILNGWQGRELIKGGTLKYITHKRRGIDLCFYSTCVKGKSDTVCIVEDVLSAIRCSEFVDGVAVLGTRYSNELIFNLTDGYSHVIIYLDNDNSIVKKKQEQLKSILSLYVDKVSIIKTNKDPKELSPIQLKTILEECE